MSLSQLAEILSRLELPGSRSAARHSLEKLLERVHFLRQVGLGYLHLNQEAGTLSAGEVQRVRLASLLGSGLTSLTLLVDEPTRGLAPRRSGCPDPCPARLRHEGNTVILVEHDLQVIQAADYLVEMGPGAGRRGGRVVAQGAPEQGAWMPTAGWLRSKKRVALPIRADLPAAG